LKATKKGDKVTLTLDGLEALRVECGLRGSSVEYERRADEAKEIGNTVEEHLLRKWARDCWNMANLVEAETAKG